VRKGPPLVAALVFAVTLAAQDNPFRLRVFDDRQEGVLDSIPVSDSSLLELVGVELPSDPREDRGASLSVRLPRQPRSSPAKVKVHHPHQNYLMIPKPESLGLGPELFSWPRGPFIDALNMDIRELRVLVSDDIESTYFPAYLASSSSVGASQPAPTYRFYFRTSGEVTAIPTIEQRAEEGRPTIIARLSRISEPYGGLFSVSWEGNATSGERAPGGIYTLALRGRVLVDRPYTLYHFLDFHHDD
jgi:hypothetical protein